MRLFRSSLLASLMISLGLAVVGRSDDAPGWTVLSQSLGNDVWRTGKGAWFIAGDAKMDPANPKLLVGVPGEGVIINGPTGRTGNLVSKKDFGDVEFHCEFLIPKGSNSGVKFENVYEIQIFDSYGRKTLNGGDCGGIYPRAELLPTYHHLDEGYAPLVNACKAPGEWQTLDVIFLAPRFDESGKKTASAKIVKAVLNGQVIHKDREVPCPTGNNWSKPEKPRGPIMLQADHGPVAFRNIRARDYKGE